MKLIKKVIEIDDWKVIAKFIIKSILTILLGGVFYMLLANALLLRYNIEISTYKGASEVSIGNIITSFPTSMVRCYREFFEYFAKHNMYFTIPRKSFLLLIGFGLFILACIIRLFVKIWYKDKIYAICFLGCVGLIPVASCAILLIVQGAGMILLMSMSLAVSLVLCISICIEAIPAEEKCGIFIRRLGRILMLLLLWVEVLTVTRSACFKRRHKGYGKNSGYGYQ